MLHALRQRKECKGAGAGSLDVDHHFITVDIPVQTEITVLLPYLDQHIQTVAEVFFPAFMGMSVFCLKGDGFSEIIDVVGIEPAMLITVLIVRMIGCHPLPLSVHRGFYAGDCVAVLGKEIDVSHRILPVFSTRLQQRKGCHRSGAPANHNVPFSRKLIGTNVIDIIKGVQNQRNTIFIHNTMLVVDPVPDQLFRLLRRHPGRVARRIVGKATAFVPDIRKNIVYRFRAESGTGNPEGKQIPLIPDMGRPGTGIAQPVVVALFPGRRIESDILSLAVKLNAVPAGGGSMRNSVMIRSPFSVPGKYRRHRRSRHGCLEHRRFRQMHIRDIFDDIMIIAVIIDARDHRITASRCLPAKADANKARNRLLVGVAAPQVKLIVLFKNGYIQSRNIRAVKSESVTLPLYPLRRYSLRSVCRCEYHIIILDRFHTNAPFYRSSLFTLPWTVPPPAAWSPGRSAGRRWPQRWGSPSRHCRLPCRR